MTFARPFLPHVVQVERMGLARQTRGRVLTCALHIVRAGYVLQRALDFKLIVWSHNNLHMLTFLGSMLASSGAFTSCKLQRQAMRAGRRVGGGTGGGARNTTGRVRALRRTRSAQVNIIKLRTCLQQNIFCTYVSIVCYLQYT